MTDYKTRKGFDINLAGRPSVDLEDCTGSTVCALYPREIPAFKQRLKVKEGDIVKRGTELLENKNNVNFKLRAPAGGTITSIIRGERRFIDKILIKIDENEQAEDFKAYSPEAIKGLDRKEIIDQLIDTGYITFIRQRPFSYIADPDATPKSIFVNAMNTGPFQADANVVIEDDPTAFQAGLDLMTRLTNGKVHLCVGGNAGEKLKSAANVDIHSFSGPHPCGNTSFHISRVDPMKPTDIVWTVKAVDLILAGRLFLDGKLPVNKIISVGGSGIKPGTARHYKVRIGGDLDGLASKCIAEGEQRLINGDIFSGSIMEDKPCLRLQQSALTVIPEGRERRFLAWTTPGFNLFSFSRTVFSSWIPRRKPWDLHSNRNGDVRAMVATGHYDKVMPMNIMVDFLIRAVLAEDTDEAIKLGILETAPEDFALCDFVCPSKIEVQAIIRQGLDMIMQEGI